MQSVKERILNQYFELHEERDGTRVSWALPPATLRQLAREADQESIRITAETGCGVSTLILAASSQTHYCFTLLQDEVDRIQAQAADLGLSLDHVVFHVGDSATRLATADLPNLDLILIDGSHAFPYPMLDWFYLAPRLREGGILIVDDVWMPSVDMLIQFLEAEEAWELKEKDEQTAWFWLTGATRPTSRYQDSWDQQGINRDYGRRDEKMRAYSKLPISSKLLRHPFTSTVVVARLLRRRFGDHT